MPFLLGSFTTGLFQGANEAVSMAQKLDDLKYQRAQRAAFKDAADATTKAMNADQDAGTTSVNFEKPGSATAGSKTPAVDSGDDGGMPAPKAPVTRNALAPANPSATAKASATASSSTPNDGGDDVAKLAAAEPPVDKNGNPTTTAYLPSAVIPLPQQARATAMIPPGAGALIPPGAGAVIPPRQPVTPVGSAMGYAAIPPGAGAQIPPAPNVGSSVLNLLGPSYGMLQ